MIENIKQKLRGRELEWQIKRSIFYEIYLQVFYRNYVKAREKEISFYSSFLQTDKEKLFFDIGASEGHKTDRFLRMGAKVVCIEPDSSCYRVLQKRFQSKSESVKILNKAVSDSAGYKPFYIHRDGSAYNTLDKRWATRVKEANRDLDIPTLGRINVETVTIDKLISLYGKPHFIKIDIEGHEINALRGLSLEVPFITFELNLPDFLEEGIECIDRLSSIDPASRFNFFLTSESGLELSENIDAEKFKVLLRNTHLKYMEILCEMNSAIFSNELSS